MVFGLFIGFILANSSLCVVESSDGYLKTTTDSTTDCNEYFLLSVTDYQSLKAGSLENTTQLFKEIFVVETEDISLVSGFMIVTFVVGHGVGRLVKTLGKHS